MRRREFITVLAGGISAGVFAQPSNVRRVGFLYPGHYEVIKDRLAAFKEGLASAHDGAQGMSFEIIARFSEGDPAQLRALAREFVDLGVDVLHAASPAAVRAVRLATDSVPIVAMDLETDPIAT